MGSNSGWEESEQPWVYECLFCGMRAVADCHSNLHIWLSWKTLIGELELWHYGIPKTKQNRIWRAGRWSIGSRPRFGTNSWWFQVRSSDGVPIHARNVLSVATKTEVIKFGWKVPGYYITPESLGQAKNNSNFSCFRFVWVQGLEGITLAKHYEIVANMLFEFCQLRWRSVSGRA